jgi:hypothetical protein
MGNSRTAKSGAQPSPDEMWELLRAAVNTVSPPGGKNPAKNGKNDQNGRAERKQVDPQPGGARLTWQAYHRLIAPIWWMGLTQAAAWLAWAVRGADHGQVRPLILITAAAFAALWTARRCWWARNPDGGKGRPRRIRTAKGIKTPPFPLSRGFLGWCLTAGAAWVTAAAYTHPGGGAAQLLWLAGGLALAVPHLHRRRYRPLPAVLAPPELVPETEPDAPEDPRLTKFRHWFCTKGPLANAWLSHFAEVPDGFSFELALAEESTANREAVVQLRPGIAAKYDVPLEQVSVEQSRVRRSERRACLTVLETVNAYERVQMWDGQSTYDPSTGAFDLGRFIDSTTGHWRLHVPGSGAAGGVIAGVIGSGKSGSAHCIACEAGQARLCAECGPQRTCNRCDMRRMCALWMGDPQMQPFGVWRGRADLMGWGPEGCMRLLLMAHRAMRARAAYFGTMKWRDHLGRENTGKGWFDPSPLFPEIYVMVDEWPLVVASEWGKWAVKLAGEIAKEGRKVGVGLVFLTQIPDLTELGERAVREMLKAFNVLAHRTDSLSKYMLGVEGNPIELPAGVHGLGYLNGMDHRPAATMRTKNIPEYLQPGQTGIDVREIAERISRNPVTYDRAVLHAITPLGFEGPLQVMGDDGSSLPSLLELMEGGGAPILAPAGPAGLAPAAAVPSLLRGPASLDAVSRIARAIQNAGDDGAELYDLMTETGLDALAAQRAASSLVASGGVTQAGDRFVASPAQQARS